MTSFAPNSCNGEVFTGNGALGPAGGATEQRVHLQRTPKGWEVTPLLLQPRDQQKPLVRPKWSDCGYPDPSATGESEALGLAQERYIDLITRTERGEAAKVLTLGEMVRRFLDREAPLISNRPHIRKEPDLVLIPVHLDHLCTGTRGSYRDRVHQLRHLNPVRPGALLP